MQPSVQLFQFPLQIGMFFPGPVWFRGVVTCLSEPEPGALASIAKTLGVVVFQRCGLSGHGLSPYTLLQYYHMITVPVKGFAVNSQKLVRNSVVLLW
jgi:hypothetical protein